MKRSPLDVAIGAKIRKMRIRKNISQQALSVHLGVSQQALSLYERGIRSVPLNGLAALAREFEKPLDYFFDLNPDFKVVVKGTKLYEILFAAPLSEAETDQVYHTVRFLLSQRKRPASRRSNVRGA